MRRHLAGAGWVAAAFAFGLSACSEQPQLLENQPMGTTVTRDTGNWEGEPLVFQAQYNRGDKASWEHQLNQRLQGQNEYVRIGGK